MKVAITVTGNNEGAKIDPRFGRAAGFIIVDLETGQQQYVDNLQNMQAAQGAGIQAAKTVSDAGAQALITGHCGPKAFVSLEAAKIKVYTGAEGSIADTIEKFKSGGFQEADGADVQGHW